MTPQSEAPRIAVVGGGYVGLVAGACFADFGLSVALIESDPERARQLGAGKSPIYEPGLSELLEQGLKEGRLKVYTNIRRGLAESMADAVFIAVGTPQDESGRCDLRYVQQAVEEVAESLQGPVVVVLKSTVPVGTAKKVAQWMGAKTRFAVSIVSNPEFLREGSAVGDFMKPDRVVIGTTDEAAVTLMRRIYDPLLRNGHPLLTMDHASAELSKYAANFMLASRISTLNQVARLSQRAGADIQSIRSVLKTDHRIGSHYLYASLGYGGSCLPKDVKAFVASCREFEVNADFAESVDRFNDSQQLLFMSDIEKNVPPGEIITVLGLAFKANTDDVRSAVSVRLLPALLEKGYRIQCHDPKAMASFRKQIPADIADRIMFAPSANAALEGASAIVLLTEWHEYQQLTPEVVAKRVRRKVVFDGRNVFSALEWRRYGFLYFGVGQ
jgi:UDPglucose 6-dehydrogenase